jgi:hypothetical protein
MQATPRPEIAVGTKNSSDEARSEPARIVDALEYPVERGVAEEHHGQRRQPGRDQHRRGGRLGEKTEKCPPRR